MMGVRRIDLHRTEEIPAPAEQVWELLTDWTGMLRWSRSYEDDNALSDLVGCELIGEAGKLPRTRRMIFRSGLTIDEELIYQNDETRRIYYRKQNEFGSIGYIATSYVDEVEEKRCTLHISVWFDVAPASSRGLPLLAWTRFTEQHSVGLSRISRDLMLRRLEIIVEMMATWGNSIQAHLSLASCRPQRRFAVPTSWRTDAGRHHPYASIGMRNSIPSGSATSA